MTNLERGLRRINDHLAHLREQVRSQPLRGSAERARLRELEALSSRAAKSLSDARQAVDRALSLLSGEEEAAA